MPGVNNVVKKIGVNLLVNTQEAILLKVDRRVIIGQWFKMHLGSLSCLGIKVTSPIFCGGKSGFQGSCLWQGLQGLLFWARRFCRKWV